MQYPVLLMPWPPRRAELRRIDWPDYLEDPTVGLIVDPTTGAPYDDVISVHIRVLDLPPAGNLEDVRIGQVVELPLADYLNMESQRIDLGRIPWAQRLEFRVSNQPPPLHLDDHPKALPGDFAAVRSFLFELLQDGPVSELEVIGQAADQGIPIPTLREVKKRLRIASVTDESAEYPRTLWRLRMSQRYKLQKKGAADPKRRADAGSTRDS